MESPPPNTAAFAIYGPIASSDLAGLCKRVGALLATTAAPVALCDVSRVDVDAVTVDALARLQLAARRHGCQVRLRCASSELLELVTFMGLHDVMADRPEMHDRTSRGSDFRSIVNRQWRRR